MEGVWKALLEEECKGKKEEEDPSQDQREEKGEREEMELQKKQSRSGGRRDGPREEEKGRGKGKRGGPRPLSIGMRKMTVPPFLFPALASPAASSGAVGG